MSYHLSTSFFFVAQVMIHLVTGTIVVVLNIGIGRDRENERRDSGYLDDLKKT